MLGIVPWKRFGLLLWVLLAINLPSMAWLPFNCLKILGEIWAPQEKIIKSDDSPIIAVSLKQYSSCLVLSDITFQHWSSYKLGLWVCFQQHHFCWSHLYLHKWYISSTVSYSNIHNLPFVLQQQGTIGWVSWCAPQHSSIPEKKNAIVHVSKPEPW